MDFMKRKDAVKNNNKNKIDDNKKIYKITNTYHNMYIYIRDHNGDESK